jgi:hypothetical protein
MFSVFALFSLLFLFMLILACKQFLGTESGRILTEFRL